MTTSAPTRVEAFASPQPTKPSILKQPTAVWAIAFAAAVSFMGIGLVDPILTAISHELNASPSQTMLLFTSYLFITGIAMLFTGYVSSRIGAKKTLIGGLVLVVVFATLAGSSHTVNQIIGFRAGWGLGNALFISTALSAIVMAASGGSRQAIVLYEAAMGVGMAVGPLLGGALGSVSWRGPFFGTAALMLIGLVAVATLLKSKAAGVGAGSQAGAAAGAGSDAASDAGAAAGTDAAPAQAEPIHFLAGIRALRNPALLTLGLTALCYNFAFFSILAYSPYPLEDAANAAGVTNFGASQLGLVFFGWGLALAISSVFVAPRLTRKFGLVHILVTMFVLFSVVLVLLAVLNGNLTSVIVLVVVSGLVSGVINTAMTEAVMEATDLPKSVASSTYSGIRFMGGAISPAVAGSLSVAFGAGGPYWVSVVTMVIGVVLLLSAGHRFLGHIGRPHATALEEAEAITAGE